jgi:hypothetical protein
MLARIVKHGDGDWRSTDAAFEKVALAIESGEQIILGEDVTNLLEDVPLVMTEQERFSEREDLEDIASRVIVETFDHVYTGTDIGGVDLHAPLPTISDDWEVPELTFDEKDKLHQVLTSDNLTPHVSTTLTIDEREAFLVHSDSQIDGLDKMRARETTASINNLTDQMFEQMSIDHIDSSNQLTELENEMIQLAEKSRDANVEELIQIADRVGEIELLLGNISETPNYTMLTPIVVLTPFGEEA